MPRVEEVLVDEDEQTVAFLHYAADENGRSKYGQVTNTYSGFVPIIRNNC